MLAEAVEHDLGQHRLGQPSQAAEEPEQPADEQQSPVRPDILEQQPERWPPEVPATGAGNRGRMLGHRVVGTRTSGRK